MIPPALASAVPDAARQWHELGYRLVAWPADNGKGPNEYGWGLKAANPARVSPSDNIGVIHGLSGTAALDLDHPDLSLRVLEALGLDLNELIGSTTAWRGRPDRAKLLFRAPSPAQGVRKLIVWTEHDADEPVTVLELRGAGEGAQVQDVLPPSRHPDTGKPYELVTPLRAVAELPPMPAQLLDVWTHWKEWNPALRRICGDVRLERETPAPRPSPARPREGASVIDAFNARYSLAEVLERNGYERRGKRRWLRPGSTTGTPGVVLLPDDRAVYCHGGGALNDERPHDAFDCYRLLEHAGDFTAAVRTAAHELGLERATPVPTITSAIIKPPSPAQVEKPRSRIQLRHLAEIVAERRTVRWLLPKVLEADVLALLAGRRGSFKSFIALDWALRIALRGSPVVILSGEGAGLDRRTDAWMRTHAPEADLAALQMLALERAVNLSVRDVLVEVTSAIDEANITPALILVDTFSKYSPGLDENSNQEVAQFLAGLSVELRERYGCTVLLVAHTGHGDQKRARGASALGANTDAEFIVERPEGTDTVTVSRSRYKDAPELPPLAYRTENIDLGRVDEEGARVTSLVLHSIDAPPVRPRAVGVNQNRAVSGLLEWARSNPERNHITTSEFREVMRTQGIDRRRLDAVRQFLIDARGITPSIGGYTLDPAALR